MFVVHFFDFVDLRITESLGVKSHFPEFFCFFYRPFFFQFLEIMD